MRELGRNQRGGRAHGYLMVARWPFHLSQLHPYSREAASDKEKVLVPISGKQNFPKSPADSLIYLVFCIDKSQNICLIISLAESKHFYLCIVHVEKRRVQSHRQAYNLGKQCHHSQCFVIRARNYQVRQLVRIPFYLNIIFIGHGIICNIFGVS